MDLPWPTMGLCPDKPIVGWKSRSQKCTEYTWPTASQLSPASPKAAESTHVSLFYNKVLTISCNWLNTVLKVRNGLVVRVQDGLSVSVVHQHYGKGLYCISPAREKIKIQHSKYRLYWKCITFAPLWSRKIVRWIIVSQGWPVLRAKIPTST